MAKDRLISLIPAGKDSVYHLTDYHPDEDFIEGHDYPSWLVALFERELSREMESGLKSDVLFIPVKMFENSGYEWLPFTLAMHALIICPRIAVVFADEEAECLEDISKKIDLQRGRRLEALRNFAVYTNVSDDNRAHRVYLCNKEGGKSCYEELVRFRKDGLSPYYKKWLREPWHVDGMYYTHPFDHLPVRNFRPGPVLQQSKTMAQWAKEGREVVDEGEYILAHPQIGTVSLNRYYHEGNTREKEGVRRRKKGERPGGGDAAGTASGGVTIQRGVPCPFERKNLAGGPACRTCGSFGGWRGNLVICRKPE